MFRRTKRICLLSLFILTALWGVASLRIRLSDVTHFKKRFKKEKEAPSKNLFSTTHQQRKGVVKEIWFAQEDGSRLQYRIFSETSLLIIRPEGNSLDLVEKLEHLKCWMQDKLYDPSSASGPTQQIRYLAAEEGVYRYTSQEFLAQSVALSLFRLNGHELPKETLKTRPFLKGIAQDVSFAVSGKNPQFNAKHFKAELNTVEEKK
jgi:hypothetical protein